MNKNVVDTKYEYERSVIDAYWDKAFKESRCKFCGQGNVNRIYKDFATHQLCEEK